MMYMNRSRAVIVETCTIGIFEAVGTRNGTFGLNEICRVEVGRPSDRAPYGIPDKRCGPGNDTRFSRTGCDVQDEVVVIDCAAIDRHRVRNALAREAYS